MYDNFRSVQSRNALQIDLNHFSTTHLIVFRLEVCVDVAVAVSIFALFSYIICGLNSICLEKRFNNAWKCVLQYWPTSYLHKSQRIYCSSAYIEFYPNELTEQFLCGSTLILSFFTRLFCMHYDSLSIQTFMLLKRRMYVKIKFFFFFF